MNSLLFRFVLLYAIIKTNSGRATDVAIYSRCAKSLNLDRDEFVKSCILGTGDRVPLQDNNCVDMKACEWQEMDYVDAERSINIAKLRNYVSNLLSSQLYNSLNIDKRGTENIITYIINNCRDKFATDSQYEAKLSNCIFDMVDEEHGRLIDIQDIIRQDKD